MTIIEDPMRIAARTTTIYPAPFKDGLEGRLKRALTGHLGLTQFGVNVTTLEPGARSSQRHWHEVEDECIYVLSGELTLVDNDGEHTLPASSVVGFPAGEKNGHCLINKSNAPATYLEIGTRSQHDTVVYPDIDLKGEKRDGTWRLFHKDGTPYA